MVLVDDQPIDDGTETESTGADATDDTVVESDNDVLFGGTGDDWIFGEGGNDTLFGSDSPLSDELLEQMLSGRLG